ncbi:glycosyltransferase family 2 protein [Cryptosporangium aurantiacum]|uniref:Glycosyltransferase, GT2 family n=1 Tax=Cryptosporangium aurantiacum TaxID=134849 RepID=A0A1M7RMV1_9ACTN|nr:glycosyltransferase [Cryptosporangium aurantiacum]SHN47574.1 Glycosyltransferase, GT2 family [Cryptosporangium aurantiacum]
MDATPVTVGIACYSEARWNLLIETIASVQAQEYPHRIVVAVDHNPALFERLIKHYGDEITVLENQYQRGASGSRNTIGLAATTRLVAFLDDDTYAEAGWLAALVDALDAPGAERVVGAGGRILPVWHRSEPRWFPREFGWVIGATLPAAGPDPYPIRNVWAASMIVRREIFTAVGGFRADFGKVGEVSEPEDTELCLRMARTAPGAHWLHVPAAVIRHHVPAERSSVGFFLRRCWLEGRGKAGLATLTRNRSDRAEALSEESSYLRRVLPAGMRAYLRQGDAAGLAKAGMVLVGVAITGLGFTLGLVRSR